jgi:hypothetical protein
MTRPRKPPIVARFEMLPVGALVEGGLVTLVDARGTVLARCRVDEIGEPTHRVREFLLWQRHLRKAVAKLEARVNRALAAEWERKAYALEMAMHLRSRRKPRYQGGRMQKDTYNTKTWADASSRMWMQAANAFCRHRRSGWKGWAETSSNNLNKRKGGFYYVKAGEDSGESNPGIG